MAFVRNIPSSLDGLGLSAKVCQFVFFLAFWPSNKSILSKCNKVTERKIFATVTNENKWVFAKNVTF